MYLVYNIIESAYVFSGNESEFIDFTRNILKENGDIDFSIISITDAEEYINNYCDDLSFIDQSIIENSIVENEEIGKKIREYCEKYENTPMYDEILLAIEFGYNLNKEQ